MVKITGKDGHSRLAASLCLFYFFHGTVSIPATLFFGSELENVAALGFILDFTVRYGLDTFRIDFSVREHGCALGRHLGVPQVPQ